jgi:hypothetical protein
MEIPKPLIGFVFGAIAACFFVLIRWSLAPKPPQYISEFKSKNEEEESFKRQLNKRHQKVI